MGKRHCPLRFDQRSGRTPVAGLLCRSGNKFLRGRLVESVVGMSSTSPRRPDDVEVPEGRFQIGYSAFTTFCGMPIQHLVDTAMHVEVRGIVPARREPKELLVVVTPGT